MCLSRSVLCSCREREPGEGKGVLRDSFVCSCLLLRSLQDLGWALPRLCQSGDWGDTSAWAALSGISTLEHRDSSDLNTSAVPPLFTLPRNSHVQPVKHPWCAQAGERENVLSFPRAGTWENTPEIFPIPGQGRDKRSAKSFFHFIFHHPQLSRDRTSPWHGPLPWPKPD